MTSQEEVKLLNFWASPFGKRVEWALKLKGVEYEYIEENIFNKSNLLLELNPVHKRVPVLVHNHKPIPESFFILEYIDETWDQYPLLPQHPYQRALARFWANFVEHKLVDAAWIAMISRGDDKENALRAAREVMEKIEGEIKGKKYFGGDNIGYLDIALGWISYWLPVWEELGSFKIIDSFEFPSISAWITNFLSHPVIQANLPPRDKMLVYYESRRKTISSSFQGSFKLVKTSYVAMCSSGDEQEKNVKEVREVMDKIEEEIKGKKYFGGDNIGYLDIALGWIPCWLPIWEEIGSMQIIDPLKHSSISAWITNFLTHPVIKDSLPSRDKVIVYSHRRKREFPSTLRSWFMVSPYYFLLFGM